MPLEFRQVRHLGRDGGELVVSKEAVRVIDCERSSKLIEQGCQGCEFADTCWNGIVFVVREVPSTHEINSWKMFWAYSICQTDMSI